LLSVELVMRLEGQQLDEQLRLAARPAATLDRDAVDGDAEWPKQVDLQRRRYGNLFGHLTFARDVIQDSLRAPVSSDSITEEKPIV
jgi:hypothetical protein